MKHIFKIFIAGFADPMHIIKCRITYMQIPFIFTKLSPAKGTMGMIMVFVLFNKLDFA